LAQHDLTEEDYGHVSEWATWPGYSDSDRIAIEYAEKFAVDHLSLDDAWFDRARTQFTDEQLHGMAIMIGSWIAGGRLQTIFDVHLSCPLVL
jgi:alkylhydroperoxidase family enzyme